MIHTHFSLAQCDVEHFAAATNVVKALNKTRYPYVRGPSLFAFATRFKSRQIANSKSQFQDFYLIDPDTNFFKTEIGKFRIISACAYLPSRELSVEPRTARNDKQIRKIFVTA